MSPRPLLFLGLFSTAASAHIALSQPPTNSTDMKIRPCGAPAGGVRTGYDAGQTITVIWDETIDHPGHYRIAFDDDGRDVFQDPTGFTDVSGGPGVLLDGIPDGDAGVTHYEVQLTLPSISCDTCTLQVIQVMTDKGPVWGDNDVYYQCADLRLVLADGGVSDGGTDGGAQADAGPGADGGVDGGAAQPDAGTTPGATGGCGCSSGGAGLAVLALLLLLGLRVRRAPR